MTLNQITYNTDVNNTVYENIDNMLMFQVLLLNTIVIIFVMRPSGAMDVIRGSISIVYTRPG